MLGRALALQAAGAERFDPGHMQAIFRLLDRAEGAREGLRRRLEERARRHLFALELRFESAKAAATSAVEQVARKDAGAAKALRDQLQAGDVDGVRRAAHRLLARGAMQRVRPALERLRAMIFAVEQRCPTRPLVVREARDLLERKDLPGDELITRAHDLANRLALVLVETGTAELATMLEVERMVRAAPSAYGPYNPDALSTRVISEFSALSPSFARAWFSWVRDLEPLTQLPPAPDEKPSKPTKAPKSKKSAGTAAPRSRRAPARED